MKNTYTNEVGLAAENSLGRPAGRGFAALARSLNRLGIEILRYGLVIVLVWIGGMKFTGYEAAGIAPLETHSPLVNWLYVLLGQRHISDLLGVIEITLGIGIALRHVTPRISGIASLLSVGMFLTTLSFIFTTPGWEPTLGFPALSAMPGQFLLKDIVLLGASVFTVGRSIFRGNRTKERNRKDLRRYALTAAWTAGREASVLGTDEPRILQ